jgi:TfoX/Sxy family transcriptional regulator of competence genes
MPDEPDPSPAELYEDVIAYFSDDADVEQSRMFGSSGLSVGRKTFAMLHRSELVAKLDPERCRSLVEGGVARFFDPGHGRLMKAWVTLDAKQSVLWTSLAAEARDLVAGLAVEERRKTGSRKRGK